MKTLLRKELRANVKVAVLGLAVFILLLAQSYRSASDTVERVVRDGYYGQNYNDLQPLLASTLLMETTLFCAAFGALLGFLQIFHERHQDLWAFLVHRPATRTQIFLSKIGAGLALYLLAAGLPLLFLVAFVATPGHVAAPFEWGMILPVTASFLAGIVYYFAGMLTGLRQARWYGSRGLGLGLALVISLCVSSSLFGVTSDLPLAACFSVIAMGAGFLVLAVWGGFQSNGQYEGQPLAAKGALTLVLSTGAGVVVFAALGLLAMLLGTAGYSWFYYQMDRDGTIYKVMNLPGKPARIVDLQGNPLTDEKTGRMVTINEFNQRSAPGYGMDVDFGDRGRRARYYGPGGRFFTLWQVTPDTLWYYWWRYRRVVGFDVRTRRIIGSLGPKGFVPDLASAPDRFGLVSEYYYWLSSKILRTATAVYDVDVESRSAALVFSAPPGETIGGAVATGGRGQPPGQFAVATRQFIRLLSPTGQEIWKAPYEPAYPKYTAVRISFLADTNHFALWIEPSAEAKVAAGGTLPSRVFWINDSEPNSRSADLPALPQPAGPDIMGKLALGLAPPGLAFIIPLIDHDAWREIKRQGHGAAFISLVVVALVCAMAGWLLGWRYNLSPRARIGWAVFHLVAGIPGLLGFLSVQDWPARESCPSCKRLRVVNRNDCEHCGAGFAPPHKTGIEIFEPLAPAKVEA